MSAQPPAPVANGLRSKSFMVRKPSSPTLLTTPGPPKELLRRSMSRPERGPELRREMLVRPPHVEEEEAVGEPKRG